VRAQRVARVLRVGRRVGRCVGACYVVCRLAARVYGTKLLFPGGQNTRGWTLLENDQTINFVFEYLTVSREPLTVRSVLAAAWYSK